MKKIILLSQFVIVSLICHAQAPSWLWAETESTGSCWMDSRGISASPSGGIYMTGRFSGTMTLGGQVATANGTEVYSGKFNSSGVFSWITPHPYSGQIDYSYGIGRDNADNTYTTGTRNSAAGGFFLDKTDSNGNLLWSTIIPLPQGYGNIAIDKWSNLYVTGDFFASVNFGPVTLNSDTGGSIFLAKFDSNGVCKWAVNAGSNSAENGGRGVVIDKAGNIYVCGSYSGTPQFGTITVPPANASYPSFFIAKYDSSGVAQWVNTATNAGLGDTLEYWDYNGIAIDSSANIYVTGHFVNTAQFGNLWVTSAGEEDIFVAKCGSNGTWDWVQSAGGTGSDEGLGLTLDKYFDVYVTGYFQGTAQFDGQSVSSSGYNTAADYDLFVAKYDYGNGNLQWVQVGGGSASLFGNWITVDNQGFVYITGGITGDSGIFGPSLVNDVLGCGVYDQNVLIAKLDTVIPSAVWPGDANDDLIVNNYDLIPIGQYYSETGPPRDTVTNSWAPHPAINWGSAEINGYDKKHVDCNGDGVINSDDTLAITLNYGDTHLYHSPRSSSKERSSGVPLYFIADSSLYHAGSKVHVAVWLGDSTTKATNVYGLAYDIDVDTSLIQPGTLAFNYSNSFIGTKNSDALSLTHISDDVETAVTRINHINKRGYGKIGDLYFTLNASISNPKLLISVSSSLEVDSVGNFLVLQPINDTLTINKATGVNRLSADNYQLSIYPNPTSGQFTVQLNGDNINYTVEVYNVMGEKIYQSVLSNSQNLVNLSSQSAGVYFVYLKSDEGVEIGKVLITK